MFIKLSSVFLSCILLSACASISSRPPEFQTYDYANVLFERGSFEDAHDAYRYLAEAHPTLHMVQEAAFKDAYILVYYNNPYRDLDEAQLEFSEFLQRYPSSTLSDQAQSCIAVLKSFDQSKTHELMMKVELISKKINNLWTEIENRKADLEKLKIKQDALFAEKKDLSKKVDELLKENGLLLSEKTAVVVE
jgi:tetratricopeptide (TPR) repeat protein